MDSGGNDDDDTKGWNRRIGMFMSMRCLVEGVVWAGLGWDRVLGCSGLFRTRCVLVDVVANGETHHPLLPDRYSSVDAAIGVWS